LTRELERLRPLVRRPGRVDDDDRRRLLRRNRVELALESGSGRPTARGRAFGRLVEATVALVVHWLEAEHQRHLAIEIVGVAEAVVALGAALNRIAHECERAGDLAGAADRR